MAVRWILINDNDEPVDPEKISVHHLEEALEDAENLVVVLRAEIAKRDEDPNSPFYGLTQEQGDALMRAIENSNQQPSKIKGRSLPSRKDNPKNGQ